MASSLSLSAGKGLVAPSRTNLSRRQQRAARRALAAAVPRAEAVPPAEPAAAPDQQQLAAQARAEQRAMAPRTLSPLATFGHMQQARSSGLAAPPQPPPAGWRRHIPAPFWAALCVFFYLTSAGYRSIPHATLTAPHSLQMMAEMDHEMAQLGRAFGMPMPGMALSPLSSLLAEVPGWAAPSSLTAPAAISLAVDIQDAGDALHITADVPGVPAESLKLEVSWRAELGVGRAGGSRRVG